MIAAMMLMYEEINDDRSNDADEYWRICTGR